MSTQNVAVLVKQYAQNGDKLWPSTIKAPHMFRNDSDMKSQSGICIHGKI